MCVEIARFVGSSFSKLHHNNEPTNTSLFVEKLILCYNTKVVQKCKFAEKPEAEIRRIDRVDCIPFLTRYRERPETFNNQSQNELTAAATA